MNDARVLLKNAVLATLEPPRVERADLRIDGGEIVARGAALAPHPGEDVVDVAGALVLPGLVNAHTHLYSALARGMPAPAEPPGNFVQILERVWWRLDRALDAEAVELSALVGAIEAARSGTTLVVDHHASPSCIAGSLATIRKAVEAVGLRSVLCYETTDRNGGDGRNAGLEENLAHLGSGAAPLTRGLIGAHAAFTLSEETLELLGGAVEDAGAGFHVHAAEDAEDVRDCRERFGSSLPELFARHGLLGPRTLLAHGVHLTREELAVVASHGAWLVHNPRSNMNNHVGHAALAGLERVALGTDGMDQDCFAETRAAYLKLRDVGRADAFVAALGMLAGGHRLAAELFGQRFGALEAGAAADLAILDYRSPTPLDAANLGGHLLFGLDRSHVRSVLVAGRWVLRDRRVTGVDEEAVFARARAAAAALWKRMRDTDPS